MMVLQATSEQASKLQGVYKNGAVLQFILDAKDNFVVNTNVLNDANFSEAHSELKLMPFIEFEPKVKDGLW